MMAWPDVVAVASGCLGVAWSASKIARAWHDKVLAEGAKAEAERQKLNEVKELRDSHAKNMVRQQKLEDRIMRVEMRMSIERRVRAETAGIPVVVPEDDPSVDE